MSAERNIFKRHNDYFWAVKASHHDKDHARYFLSDSGFDANVPIERVKRLALSQNVEM